MVRRQRHLRRFGPRGDPADPVDAACNLENKRTQA
jgi:hypothetical protein